MCTVQATCIECIFELGIFFDSYQEVLSSFLTHVKFDATTLHDNSFCNLSIVLLRILRQYFVQKVSIS